MPASSNDPFPGYVQVLRDNSGIGEREWVLFANYSNSAKEDAAPGDAFTLEYTETSSGISPPDAATSVVVRCYLPNSTTQVGNTWTITSTTSNQSLTMHMDDNPLNQSSGAARAGMLEIHMTVIKSSVPAYEYDSRGDGLGNAGDQWVRGYMRSLVTIDSNSLSNVSHGGAEPALFAYPDQIYKRVTFDTAFYDSDLQDSVMVQDGVEIDAEQAGGTGPTFDWFYTNVFEIVDSEYAVGDLDLRVILDNDTISGNRGTFDEYKLAATGHQAGWVRTNDRQIDFVGRTSIDPTVTLENNTYDQPNTSVFNRGETASGSFEVHNARGEAITPVGNDTVTVKSGLASEEAVTTSRSAGVVTWSVEFNSSGNVAPADTVGDEKELEWQDTTTSITLDWPRDSIGFLSSLLDVANVVTSYSGTNDTVYNRNETATVTGNLLNRRGNGFEGFTGEVFRSVNSSNSALEETLAIDTHTGSTGAFSLTLNFGASGNDAPATEAGANKLLSWTDASGNIAINDDALCSLSSLVDVVAVVTSYAGLNNTVYNRNETATVTGILLNRRGDGFEDFIGEAFRSVNSSNSALEETLAIDTHTGSTGAFSLTLNFGTSGNDAPSTEAGADKLLSWTDSSGNTAIDDALCSLSSLVDVVTVVTSYAGLSDTVYNRGESAEVTGSLLNRRGDGFEDFTGEVFRSVNSSDTALEDTASVDSHDGATGAFILTMPFGTSGNVAPADTAGANKLLSWSDNSGNTASDDQLAALSSLLDVDIHLQLNNSTLDTSLFNFQRLASDLGFYSVRLTNRRGLGKNGISVTDNLHDDLELINSVARTDTTTTVNSLDGWLPLKAWDSSLPGGGWDHWVDAGNFEGNEFEKERQPTGFADYTLLAKNPNNIVICGGGHNTAGEGGLHWTAGSDLLVGALMFDVGTNNSIKVDDSVLTDPGGEPLPRAYMSINRLNVATGESEFFDEDKTWKSIEANQGNVHQFQLLSVRRGNELTGNGSVGDEKTYIMVFPEEDTEGWGESDLFFIPVLYQKSTPYSLWGITGVVGSPNGHNGYAVDPIALGLHGVIGTR
jgi:hypothetical protein